MAHAMDEGARARGAVADCQARALDGAQHVAKNQNFKTDQAAPIATVAELENCDAVS